MEPGLTGGRCGRTRPHLPPAARVAAGERRAVLIVLPLHLLAVLLVAGCGGSPAPSGQSTPPDATPSVAATPAATSVATPGTASEMTGIDLLFLSMMAGHTEQTLQIVRLVRDRLVDSELRTLVAAVAATESDELTTVRGWLAQAGRSARADDHAGHGTGPEQLARLRHAPDDAVDTVLIEVLSAHQKAAADLARAHLSAGTDARVLDLARRVEQSRTAQVTLMTDRAAAG